METNAEFRSRKRSNALISLLLLSGGLLGGFMLGNSLRTSTEEVARAQQDNKVLQDTLSSISNQFSTFMVHFTALSDDITGRAGTSVPSEAPKVGVRNNLEVWCQAPGAKGPIDYNKVYRYIDNMAVAYNEVVKGRCASCGVTPPPCRCLCTAENAKIRVAKSALESLTEDKLQITKRLEFKEKRNGKIAGLSAAEATKKEEDIIQEFEALIDKLDNILRNL